MNKAKMTLALAASLGLAFGGAALADGNGPASATLQNTTAGMHMGAMMAGMQGMGGMQGTNWFGGPIYNGAPHLKATAALVRAGGGVHNFKFSTALVSMLGQKTVNAEVAKLTKQYGKKDVMGFIHGMTFAVNDALKRATEQGISLPQAPASLKGPALAKGLVKAGLGPNDTFWAGHMFDVAISHKLHNQVMADIDAKFSHAADKNTHKILNQAMFDVAHALGQDNVKLASLH